jgi:hypothetical protein
MPMRRAKLSRTHALYADFTPQEDAWRIAFMRTWPEWKAQMIWRMFKVETEEQRRRLQAECGYEYTGI